MEDLSANNADFQHNLDGKMGLAPGRAARECGRWTGRVSWRCAATGCFLAIDLLCGLAMERMLAEPSHAEMITCVGFRTSVLPTPEDAVTCRGALCPIRMSGEPNISCECLQITLPGGSSRAPRRHG